MVYLIIARDQGKFILRVIWLLAFAGAFNLHHHLVLNGGSLETSIVVHLNNSLENKSGTSCLPESICNTIPNLPEKFRKQVIKLYTRRLLVYRNQR